MAMLDKANVKHLHQEELKRYEEFFREELGLTEHRLFALRKRQARDPNWSFYDSYIDEEVGINILIEGQEAVEDEYTEQLRIIEAEQGRRQGLNQTIRMF